MQFFAAVLPTHNGRLLPAAYDIDSFLASADLITSHFLQATAGCDLAAKLMETYRTGFGTCATKAANAILNTKQRSAYLTLRPKSSKKVELLQK